MPSDWHLVHLGSRAVGGAGLVMQEATAVSPEGRISPADAGIWSDAHSQAYERIAAFIKQHGAVAGIQLAHAGRKASTSEPWNGGQQVKEENGGWQPLAPTAERFKEDYPLPREMNASDMDQVEEDFCRAAKRAIQAGFEVIEVHAAHGYLLHEFLSPLSNKRTDEYGGSLENRMRFPGRIIRKVRDCLPSGLPMFVRISATDWTEAGWDLPQSIEFCKALKKLDVDLVDTSSGGNVPHAKIPVGPGYQVNFAAEIRRQAAIPTAAVGMISEPAQAEAILEQGQADAILMAREFLREPYFPFTAAKALGVKLDYVPIQYGRAFD